MTIFNLTPHTVAVIKDNGDKEIFLSSGVARLKMETVQVGDLNGIPLKSVKFGDPEGLPEPEIGTYLIVSQLIKSALPNRVDLIVPTDIVRDKQGNIIGCKSFQI